MSQKGVEETDLSGWSCLLYSVKPLIRGAWARGEIFKSCTQHKSLKYQRVRPLKFSFLFVVLETRHQKGMGAECGGCRMWWVQNMVACWSTQFAQVTPLWPLNTHSWPHASFVCMLPGIRRCPLEGQILFPYLHRPCNVVVHMIDVDVSVGTE